MRAREPDIQGHVDCDGLSVGYEVFGDGDPTLLLMPTWSIIPSRFWKFQVPYLSRHYRVITFDGPGSGRTERTTDPERYSIDAYAGYAATVLDRCGADRAVVMGLSLGGAYTARFAARYPDRARGVVMVAPAIAAGPPDPDRAKASANLMGPYPENPQGWEKYNIAYWHDHYESFIHFFMGRIFTEDFSTKAFDDAVGWGLETTPDILEAEARKPPVVAESVDLLDGIKCPVLVIQGTEDEVLPYQIGAEVARITGGTLHTMEGSGHVPLGRDPVHVNLILKDFVERVVAR